MLKEQHIPEKVDMQKSLEIQWGQGMPWSPGMLGNSSIIWDLHMTGSQHVPERINLQGSVGIQQNQGLDILRSRDTPGSLKTLVTPYILQDL